STRSPFRLGIFGERFSHVFHFKDKGQSVVSVHGVELPLADFVALHGGAIMSNEQDSGLNALALSPNGRTLATAVYAPTVIDGMEPANVIEAITLRDTSTGKVRVTLKTGKIS